MAFGDFRTVRLAAAAAMRQPAVARRGSPSKHASLMQLRLALLLACTARAAKMMAGGEMVNSTSPY